MTTFSNRWLLLLLLVLSAVLWLGISSVTANAVHVLAKSNFALRPFGTVSVWLLASAIIWSLVISFALSVSPPLTAKSIVLGAGVVAVWAVALVALTAVGDEALGHLGGGAIVVWVFEIVVAGLLMRMTCPLLLTDLGLQSVLLGAIASLVWLTLAKAALLCASPGVVIRM